MSMLRFFLFCYFHGFFIYMVVDSAFRDWSVMIVVWFFSRDCCSIHKKMFFYVKD